jgi:prophage protein DUF1660
MTADSARNTRCPIRLGFWYALWAELVCLLFGHTWEHHEGPQRLSSCKRCRVSVNTDWLRGPP